ncbi:hypothetical protein OY671_012105, partial [Metschnikowia pulcherrima]
FTLAAARSGWPLQDAACLGLHAAPSERLRPHLSPGRRVSASLRDGDAVAASADYLSRKGFGTSASYVSEASGGPRERVRSTAADASSFTDVAHPVAVGIECAGDGRTLPSTPGRPDDWFASDGQLTKSPVRASTLSASVPRPGELSWDIGAGSG